MAKRGRKPKPTLLKELADNPGKRPLNKDEPKGDGEPIKPEYLNDAESKIWDSFTPPLVRMGICKEQDSNIMTRYCFHFDQWQRARAKIIEVGESYVVREPGGNIKYIAQIPEVSIAKAAHKICLEIESQFGGTASARSGLKVPKEEKKESELTLLLAS